MLASTIPDILDVVLFVITFCISVRAFYLYFRVRSPRLFILALAMLMIALTATADFASVHITSVTLHTDWFLYIGQSVSFLWIFLSLVNAKEDFQGKLMTWHIVVSVIALVLLLTATVLPDVPNGAIRVVLSASRCVTCFMVFFAYTAAFMSKQTRFSLMMGVAFLFLGIGYLVIFQQYFIPNAMLLDNIGDITRLVGLLALLYAVLRG